MKSEKNKEECFYNSVEKLVLDNSSSQKKENNFELMDKIAAEENSIESASKKKNLNKCKWNKDEEKLLIDLKEKGYDWDIIATNFVDKPREKCYLKYSKMTMNFKKGKWTKQEDDYLLGLIQENNFNWKFISSKFKDRSLTQIKQRYNNCLDPNINKKKFSEEEDKILMEKYKIYGADWKKISTFFINRPTNLIKNRFYTKTRNCKKGKKLCFILFMFLDKLIFYL